MPSPPAIVYKTKKDFNDHVPVRLSEDKTRVASFLASTDIKINGQYTYPTKLNDGYLLANRSIGKNTAFLRFTHDDYWWVLKIHFFAFVSKKNA